MGIYRCREAFTFTDAQGVPRVITAGVLVDSDNPDYAKRLQFFEPVEAAAARTTATETATAAPGEIRARVPQGAARRRKYTRPPAGSATSPNTGSDTDDA